MNDEDRVTCNHCFAAFPHEEKQEEHKATEQEEIPARKKSKRS
jgi:hypothetical protein